MISSTAIASMTIVFLVSFGIGFACILFTAQLNKDPKQKGFRCMSRKESNREFDAVMEDDGEHIEREYLQDAQEHHAAEDWKT